MGNKVRTLMIDDTMYAPGGRLDQIAAMTHDERAAFINELRRKRTLNPSPNSEHRSTSNSSDK